MAILLNDILNFKDLNNIKIRFNKSDGRKDPIQIFKDKDRRKELLDWQFWNKEKKSYKVGQIAIGFVKIEGDKWLLFDISKVSEDLNIKNGVGYKNETLQEYEKYFGRIIIHFKNKSQQMIRNAKSVMDDCFISQILEDTFDNDVFPGYENVNLSWYDLKKVLNKNVWKTTLKNQKGVYLITDENTGKKYVGSGSGEKMLYQRWSQYIKNGHGGNKHLIPLGFNYIKENFRYSILDIYKSTIDKTIILKRESWWKNTLMTKGKFGYNDK